MPSDGYHDLNGDFGGGEAPKIGDLVAVYWPLDDALYSGAVQAVSTNGRHKVLYDDGDVETLNLCDENWGFCTDQCTKPFSLHSDMPALLANMFEYFGNKLFLRFQA